MRLTWRGLLLLLPITAVFVVTFGVPLAELVKLSFDTHDIGFVGTNEAYRFTLENYRDLTESVFLNYASDTFRLSGIACAVGLILAYPIAYAIARTPRASTRRWLLGFLVSMLFLSALIRVYSIQLTFSAVGPVGDLVQLFGVATNDRLYAEILVVVGLLHWIVPITALTLVGTLQNINPQLEEAAQVLGARRWRAVLSVSVPLSARGAISGFAISFALAGAAFVVPQILGRGKVQFLSNLVYNRFSQVADYPSGAAISLAMVVATSALLLLVSVVFTPKWDTR
jgi:ABC-type spermidine/putrescine transport system permease subunit I